MQSGTYTADERKRLGPNVEVGRGWEVLDMGRQRNGFITGMPT
jgi:hypothetical protein